MDDDLVIEITIGTQKVGSDYTEEISIDRADWEMMSDEEKDKYCFQEAMNMVDWYWQIKND